MVTWLWRHWGHAGSRGTARVGSDQPKPSRCLRSLQASQQASPATCLSTGTIHFTGKEHVTLNVLLENSIDILKQTNWKVTGPPMSHHILPRLLNSNTEYKEKKPSQASEPRCPAGARVSTCDKSFSMTFP